MNHNNTMYCVLFFFPSTYSVESTESRADVCSITAGSTKLFDIEFAHGQSKSLSPFCRCPDVERKGKAIYFLCGRLGRDVNCCDGEGVRKDGEELFMKRGREKELCTSSSPLFGHCKQQSTGLLHRYHVMKLQLEGCGFALEKANRTRSHQLPSIFSAVVSLDRVELRWTNFAIFHFW